MKVHIGFRGFGVGLCDGACSAAALAEHSLGLRVWGFGPYLKLKTRTLNLKPQDLNPPIPPPPPPPKCTPRFHGIKAVVWEWKGLLWP